MFWAFAVVILVLLVVSPDFRALFLCLLLFVGAIGGYFYIQHQDAEAAALNQVARWELQFQDVLLSPDADEYNVNRMKITGRLTNHSRQYTLDEVELVVLIHDCKDASKQLGCVTIWEGKPSIYDDIPPGQARDFSIRIDPGQLHYKGQSYWSYEVVKIRGKVPE